MADVSYSIVNGTNGVGKSAVANQLFRSKGTVEKLILTMLRVKKILALNCKTMPHPLFTTSINRKQLCRGFE